MGPSYPLYPHTASYWTPVEPTKKVNGERWDDLQFPSDRCGDGDTGPNPGVPETDWLSQDSRSSMSRLVSGPLWTDPTPIAPDVPSIARSDISVIVTPIRHSKTGADNDRFESSSHGLCTLVERSGDAGQMVGRDGERVSNAAQQLTSNET